MSTKHKGHPFKGKDSKRKHVIHKLKNVCRAHSVQTRDTLTISDNNQSFRVSMGQ